MSDQVAVTVLMPSHRPAMREEALAALGQQTLDPREIQTLVNITTKYWPGKINEIAVAARGEFMLIHCDDDLLTPHCLERMVAKAREGYDIVYADCDTFGDYHRRVEFGSFAEHDFGIGPPCWITSLVRRSKWIAVEGLDESLVYQDWDLWIRLHALGVRAARIAEPLWRYRQHAGQGSNEINPHAARQAIYAKHPYLTPR